MSRLFFVFGVRGRIRLGFAAGAFPCGWKRANGRGVLLMFRPRAGIAQRVCSPTCSVAA